MPTTFAPFARPLYVMLKPIGAACNLRCEYCYYLEKKGLYPNESRYRMSDRLLERFTKQYLESQTTPLVSFTWHGGEPLMREIDFYQKAITLQQKYNNGQQILNSLQTNGILLNDAWCQFFRKHNFLIGISIDGPQHCHDRYRKYPDGRSCFEQVIQGINLLKKHGVEFNIMGVVNDYNVNYPLEFYRFFKEMDCRFIQFTPVVERLSDRSMAPCNVPAEKWGDFLIAIFDEWVHNDVGRFFIQYFDSTLANWVGEQPGTCILAKTCGHAGIMEFNGDVYACDHLVFPQYKRGNIESATLIEMMYSSKQIQFGADKQEKLPSQCRNCEFLFACNGECPKNRILSTPDGEPNLNYLCAGYYKFFEHVAPYMDFMKKELMNKRSPANVMKCADKL